MQNKEFKKIAEASGTVVYEKGNRLYINRKPSQWTSSAMFVTGLLALVFVANGILQLFVLNKESDKISPAGIVLLSIGIFFLFLFWRIIRYRKKINSIAAEDLKCICIVDFSANNLLDADEKVLSPLGSVKLSRKFQLTSSSPALVLRWQKKSIKLVNGNPFSGGISAVESALKAKGLNSN